MNSPCEPTTTSCKADLEESQFKDGGQEMGCSSSKMTTEELEGSCSTSCSTTPHLSCSESSEFSSDVDSALASLFQTPSTLSRSSHLSSPGNTPFEYLVASKKSRNRQSLYKYNGCTLDLILRTSSCIGIVHFEKIN